jgi:hypothetical protein
MSTVIAWARVGGGGSLLAGSGVVGVDKVGVGRYHLTVDQEIGAAGLVATVNTDGGGDPGPGNASILVGAMNARTVLVRTATPSAGASASVDADRPFSFAALA